MPLPAIQHKLDVLRSHCADLGRDDAQIERTTLGTLALSTDGAPGTQSLTQAVDRFAALADLGIDHAIVNMPAVQDPAAWDLVPDLVAQLTPIVPAGR